MKTYKVWVDIEAYDTETESGTMIEGSPMTGPLAQFATLEEAEALCEVLQELHRHWSKDLGPL